MRADARMPAQRVREHGFPNGNSSICQDPGAGLQPTTSPTKPWLPSASGSRLLGLAPLLFGGDAPYPLPCSIKEAEGPRGG